MDFHDRRTGSVTDVTAHPSCTSCGRGFNPESNPESRFPGQMCPTCEYGAGSVPDHSGDAPAGHMRFNPSVGDDEIAAWNEIVRPRKA